MNFLTDRIFHIKNCSLFAELSDAEIAAIANICKVRKYAPAEVIFKQGQVPQKLLIPVSGAINLTNEHQQNLSSVKLGAFGVSSLLFDLPLNFSCLASEEGFICMYMAKSTFFTVIHECPILLVNFLQLIERGSRLMGTPEQEGVL